MLDELRRTLQAEAPWPVVQVVAGWGGVGKSEVALQFADRHRDECRLVWWLIAETAQDGRAGLGELRWALCTPLGSAAVQAPRPEAAAWALARLAAHDRWLVIFDNAEHPHLLEPLLR
ncbi:hypothetical protein GNZ18_34570 [Actinomadura sp. NEAU-AAG5]|uniref:NB-ARC domain-containing protein n=1 Tax=Actinomadura litoris TaxID=2678616 RepID=A0A7K1LB74_9ACTN|nr:hypothetical protein [Actinomadura litoris]